MRIAPGHTPYSTMVDAPLQVRPGRSEVHTRPLRTLGFGLIRVWRPPNTPARGRKTVGRLHQATQGTVEQLLTKSTPIVEI